MRAIRQSCRLIALGAALALATAVVAQPLKTDPNCNPAQFDDMQQFQAELCQTHAGCRLTFAIADKGCAAINFLRKIGDFFTRKPEISNNDVMDAAEPDYPQTDKTRAIVKKARDAASAPPPTGNSISATTNQQVAVGNGTYSSYDGGWNWQTKSAVGGGTLIRPDASMARGNWVNGNLEGAGQRITNSEVLGGEFKAGQLSGDGFKATPINGTMETVEGTFDKGIPVGEVVRNYPDGSSVREIWEGGKMIARGERAMKGQIPLPVLRPEEAAAQKALAEVDARIEASKNAGELFALADELFEKGDSAGARKALRTLMTRYPDSPLAASAANRLSGLGGNVSATASGASNAASGTVVSPTASGGGGALPPSTCPGSEQAIASEIGRRVDAYAAQNPGPTSNSTVEKLQYLLFLYEHQRKLLVSFEKCLAPDRYKLGLHEFDTITVAQTRTTCQQIASNPNDCVARYDPRWRR